jgi:hypothetical protein
MIKQKVGKGETVSAAESDWSYKSLDGWGNKVLRYITYLHFQVSQCNASIRHSLITKTRTHTYLNFQVSQCNASIRHSLITNYYFIIILQKQEMNEDAGVRVEWQEDKDGKKVLSRMAYCPSTSNAALKVGLPMLATDATHFKTVYDGSLLVLSHLTVLCENTRTHTYVLARRYAHTGTT